MERWGDRGCVDERVVLDYLCLADGEMWNGWNVKGC
jgi:hypothetical protein